MAENDKPANQPEPKYNQAQYDILKRCSDAENITEWNDWRKKNKTEDIELEGAPCQDFYLKGALLGEDPVNLYGKVYLDGAIFRMAKLQEAKFFRANLKKADLYHAIAEGANFTLASLEGADFSHANLKDATLSFSSVDGRTMVAGCTVNKGTYFLGVALSSIRIDPAMKQYLEGNIRYWRWQHWYKWQKGEYDPQNERGWLSKLAMFPIKVFWFISDYGRSTGRIIWGFFGLAFLFAAIYTNFPGIIVNLAIPPQGSQLHQDVMIALRPIYFSIVTMTTLGFGDMHAAPQSIAGHILLTIQVILGYVLLGALITRFAVLFQAGGPTGKFTELTEEETD